MQVREDEEFEVSAGDKRGMIRSGSSMSKQTARAVSKKRGMADYNRDANYQLHNSVTERTSYTQGRPSVTGYSGYSNQERNST